MSKTKFTRWEEPATVGDVLTAMIWTMGLVRTGLDLADAKANGTEAEQMKAIDAYDAEWTDFNRMIDEIGGAINDE